MIRCLVLAVVLCSLIEALAPSVATDVIPQSLGRPESGQSIKSTGCGSECNIVRYGLEVTPGGLQVFFRESGDPNKPTIVLLHGFPSSSHQYRDLLVYLGDSYHLIAPDYPGFGSSDFPDPKKFDYTFDNLANVINSFLEQRGIDRYSMMIHDYGAPVGLRIAVRHPERVETLIVQNGNIYLEGFNNETFAPIIRLWTDSSPEAEQLILDNIFTLPALRWQYTHGTREPFRILPDNWLLDFQSISRPGQDRAQLDLFIDYETNIELYPEWQEYLRTNQPPVLIVWATNDAFFSVPGAEAFRRDANDVDFNLICTGHFALEEDGLFIAAKIRSFLSARGIV